MADKVGLPRAILRAIIPNLVSSGYSANKIIGEARALGISYRRQTMLADIREVTGRRIHQAAVQALKRNVIPGKGIMAERELTRARRYLVTSEATFRDKVTNETFRKNISFYTDDLLTYDMWDSGFSAWQEESEYRIDLEFLTQEPLEIAHNKGWNY